MSARDEDILLPRPSPADTHRADDGRCTWEYVAPIRRCGQGDRGASGRNHLARQPLSDIEGGRVDIDQCQLGFIIAANDVGNQTAGKTGAACTDEDDFFFHGFGQPLFKAGERYPLHDPALEETIDNEHWEHDEHCSGQGQSRV